MERRTQDKQGVDLKKKKKKKGGRSVGHERGRSKNEGRGPEEDDYTERRAEESRGEERKDRGWEGGRATLTPQAWIICKFVVLTNILETSIDWSIIKIHTADSQRIQTGIMMPHHLHTETQTHMWL